MNVKLLETERIMLEITDNVSAEEAILKQVKGALKKYISENKKLVNTILENKDPKTTHTDIAKSSFVELKSVAGSINEDATRLMEVHKICNRLYKIAAEVYNENLKALGIGKKFEGPIRFIVVGKNVFLNIHTDFRSRINGAIAETLTSNLMNCDQVREKLHLSLVSLVDYNHARQISFPRKDEFQGAINLSNIVTECVKEVTK